jgi:hypothetical protein
MEAIMNESTNSLKIAAILSSASNAEKSEFDRRRKSYVDTAYSVKNLVAQHNHLKKSHQEILREQSKTRNIFIVLLLGAVAISSIFSLTSFYELQAIVLIGLIVSVYVIKNDIYEKAYVLQYRMLELEIDRCNNELKQYGYLLMYASRIAEDEPEAQGAILAKWHEQRHEAFDELSLAILKSMYLLPEN